MADNNNILNIRKISKSFGENEVLKNISAKILKGKIHTLMGGNGAGKTTLFNIVTGFISADSGSIFFDSKEIINTPPHNISNLGISRTFQDLRLIEKLTVKENVLLAFKNQEGEKWHKAILPKFIYDKQTRKLSQKADEILKTTFLADVAKHKAGEISYGQQKFLTLACCFANDAELFLLDEPVAGINEVYRKKMITLFKKIKQQGKTIVLIEHNEEFIRQISDIIFYLDKAKINQFSSYDELKQSKDISVDQKILL